MAAASHTVSILTMTTTGATAGRTPRRIQHLQSYGPLLRLCDRIAGRRDRGTIDSGRDRGDTVTTAYTARLQATFDEIDRHTFAHTQDACRQPATKLRELITDLPRLDALIADAESELATIPSEPQQEALRWRNGGELHLDDTAVAIRRTREHTARIGRQRATLTKLRDERNGRLAACASHAAQLLEAYELGRSISVRLRHFYNRRLATYARHAQIPAVQAPAITTPDWTSLPCPWLPAGGYGHFGAESPHHHAVTTGAR